MPELIRWIAQHGIRRAAYHRVYGINHGVKLRGKCDECKIPLHPHDAFTAVGADFELCRDCYLKLLGV